MLNFLHNTVQLLPVHTHTGFIFLFIYSLIKYICYNKT